MATSSIFHNIVIGTPEKAKRFVDALEKAEIAAQHEKKFEINARSNRDMTEEEIKEFWKSVVL